MSALPRFDRRPLDDEEAIDRLDDPSWGLEVVGGRVAAMPWDGLQADTDGAWKRNGFDHGVNGRRAAA